MSTILSQVKVGVQSLSPYQPGKPVEELERELGITEIVKLASNENPLGMSALAKQAISNAVQDGARYPDGNGFSLKSTLVDYYQARSSFDLEMSQITLGNGSNELLDFIARCFAGPGDEVIFSQYGFAVYYLSTLSVGAKPVIAPAKNWGHDLDAMLDAIGEKTKLVYIANPNNPTGTFVDRNQLEAFLLQVPKHVIVVLDEAYIEYIDDADFPNGYSLLKRFANLIVTRTFSKAWGLASLRVGYAVSSTEIADILNRVRQPFNVNSFALAAAEAVLSDEEYLRKGVALNGRGLAQLTSGLSSLGLEYIPSVGNFITFDTGETGVEVYQRLLEAGVIVRPVVNYGMDRHLRVSVGLEAENSRFLEALPAALSRT